MPPKVRREDSMEERKNSTGLIVLITVLVMLVLGMGAFIVYDNVMNNTNEPNTGENSNNENGSNTNTTQVVDIEKIKAEVSKVMSFDKLNEDFNYLKLTKSGNLVIGINNDSSLYQKYSKEYSIADDVLDVYVFNIGNGGYQYIYALKKDGTIDIMEIPVSINNFDFKWEENYKNLKNIVYLDLYSKETPRVINDAGDTFEVYDQIISAVDFEGKVYDLGQATGTVYVQK